MINNNGNRKSRRRSLSEGGVGQLTALIERAGLQAVADALGVHPQTVATLACGVAGNHSTVSHIERRIAEITDFSKEGQEA